MWLVKKRKNKKQGLGFRTKGIGLRVKGLGGGKKSPFQLLNSNSYTLTPTHYTLFLKKGFTLIELLVATSIMGIIGLTILTTFGSGFLVYERVQNFGGAQADLLLALEEMEKNLRNIFPMSTLAFVGDTQSIAFPAVIERLEKINDEEKIISSIGKISYSFDSETKEFIRSEQDYSQAVAGSEGDETHRDKLGFIEALKFSYYAYNDEEEAFSWKDSWSAEAENTLVGVKIELVYQRDSRNIELTRTVFIPTDLGIEDEIVEEDEEGEGEGEEGEGE